MKTDIEIKLKSPLCHFGDERMGTMQVVRTMKFMVGDKAMDIPVFSGNAFRGIMRRYAMKNYIDMLELEEGITTKLFYMLFSGGALTSGSRYDEIGKKRELRKMCPPLALFGTAIGDQIPQGKMKVGIFKPICKELNDYNLIQTDLSIYDFLGEVFYTRRDDLKSRWDFELSDDIRHDNPVQMKYEMQTLIAGTRLLSKIVIENSNSLDEACFQSVLYDINEVPYIGGKSATGHGEIELKYKKDKFDEYNTYIKENKKEIVEWLKEVEKKL